MVNELTAAELKDLLSTFESDKRKLTYRLNQIEKTISDLQRMVNRFGVSTEAESSYENVGAEVEHYPTERSPEETSEAPAEKPKRGRGRSRITQPAITDEAPAARKPKSARGKKKQKGYRLSDWDTALIDGLKKAGHALINQELYELLERKNEKENQGLDEKDLRGKLNRSLHKLANKRDELIKVDHAGKGFAYALRRWVTPEGQLKDKYTREEQYA